MRAALKFPSLQLKSMFCKTFPQHQQAGENSRSLFLQGTAMFFDGMLKSDDHRNVLRPTIFSAILVAHY